MAQSKRPSLKLNCIQATTGVALLKTASRTEKTDREDRPLNQKAIGHVHVPRPQACRRLNPTKEIGGVYAWGEI